MAFRRGFYNEVPFSNHVLQTKVPLGDALSIDTFVCKEVPFPAGSFRLCGAVDHVGSSAFSGHYTSCCKNGNHSVFFDDNRAHMMDPGCISRSERFQSNSALALFEFGTSFVFSYNSYVTCIESTSDDCLCQSSAAGE